jgi:2'-5' RNA ligase
VAAISEIPGALPDPHITLAFPFMDADAVTGAVLEALRERFAAVPAFAYRLTRTVRFGEVVFLEPQPAQPFRDLVRTLGSGRPPYAMPVTDILPHVTVARSADPPELDRIEAQLARALPIECRATEALLLAETSGPWETMERFPLAA